METTLSKPQKSLDASVQEFLARGFTVIPGVMSQPEIEIGRSLLDELFARERDVAEKRGWRNATYQVSYLLAGKHEFFRNLPGNPRVLNFIQKILGPDCILSSLNGLAMLPGGPSQNLHLDQAEHTPGIVININATHTLDDFTKENGATRIVPMSHLRAGKNRNFADEETNSVQVEAPAGSLIAFNGGAIHAGSANQTNAPRRCIHAFYTRPWVKAQWDFSRSFTPEIIATLSEEQKRLFGFSAREPVYDLGTNEIRTV